MREARVREKEKRFNYKKTLLGAGFGILAALLTTVITFYSPLKGIVDIYEAKTYDARFRHRINQKPRKNPIDEIVIIDIDMRSLQKMGTFRRWTHDYFAQAIEHISEGRPKAIGIDILIDPELNPAEDSLLINVTEESGVVFHAISFSEASPENFLYRMENEPAGLDSARFALSNPDLASVFPDNDRFDNMFISLLNRSRGIGSANFPPDQDGVIRRASLFDRFRNHLYPTLSAAIVLEILDLSLDEKATVPGKTFIFRNADKSKVLAVPVDNENKYLINFQGPYHSFRYISFYDVFKKRLPPAYFKDKIVLMGTSTPGLYDLRSIPVQEVFPGVEIHANAIYTLLHNAFIYRLSEEKIFYLLILLSLALGLIYGSFKPVLTIGIFLLSSIGWIFFTFSQFSNHQQVFPVVRPVLSLLFTSMSAVLYHYFVVDKDKRLIRNMFTTYMSPKVLKYLESHPEAFSLTGERRLASMFFSDVANFTTISERLSPGQLARLLNRYLSPMTDIIMSYDGYVDKYEGDAIMCEFGVPMPDSVHAVKACFAALDQQEKLAELRPYLKKEYNADIFVRMGINSGEVSAGNMGSSQRFQYTVMGDAVNQASRFEGANKQYGTSIMIGERTYQLAGNEIEVRLLDRLIVKGKGIPITVYELLGRKGALSDHKLELAGIFEEGLHFYWNRDWDRALAKFYEALKIDPDDGPSRTFISRCEIFKNNPPPDSWQGEFSMTTK